MATPNLLSHSIGTGDAKRASSCPVLRKLEVADGHVNGWRPRIRIAALVAPLSFLGIAASHAAQSGILDAYALDRRDGEQVELPGRLTEVSGLALAPDGTLWAHADERAVLYRIDPARGDVIGSFVIGNPPANGDFEGVTTVGDRMFLVTSAGELYEFRAPTAGQAAPFRKFPGLAQANCEVEGLDYDESTGTLLLACKTTRGRALRNRLVVFGFSLERMAPLDQPVFATELGALKAFDLDDELNPSGIAVHPITKTVLIVAARQNVIVELARDGTLIGARKLSGRNHRQPEGIALLADGTLYLADEGGNGRATLTRYSIEERN